MLAVVPTPEARGLESYSYKVAKFIVEGFKAKNPDAKLVRRNLAEELS
jgi:FMN-dependent NADH-azoreductase